MIGHKARFALRGDMMVPSVHFNPTQTSAPMADKHTVRIVTSIAAERGWPLEHMDMASVYFHTKFKNDKDIFVREPPRANGEYAHGKTVGRLLKNIYGGKSGAYMFR